MNAERPRFSLFVYFYHVTFFLLLGFLPIWLTATIGRAAAAPAYWLASLMWPAVIAVLWGYAQRRCSSDRMRFSDGLLWVTASMMTGWLYLSFIFVLPVLLVVFLGSVLIALYGDISRVPGYSQAKWHRLVYYFYRNRMRQS
jgi:hypothetical protein